MSSFSSDFPDNSKLLSDEAGNLLILGDDQALYSMPLVGETCYQEGAPFILDQDPFLDEINSAQLATLPAGAHMRWTAPDARALDALEVNGFNGTVGISWTTSEGDSGSSSLTFGTNPQGIALGGIILPAGGTIDFTLDSISAGQMQLGPEATSIANGWTALQDYSAFANTSHWATRLLGSTAGAEHVVREYSDGETTKLIEFVAGEPVELAAIPVGWTQKQTDAERLDALEGAIANLPAPVSGDQAITLKAIGSVQADGTPSFILNAASTRIGVGNYEIIFDVAQPDTDYAINCTMQGLPQNDDYQWAWWDKTVNGFRVEIREQDNGTAAGVLRDSGFDFMIARAS